MVSKTNREIIYKKGVLYIIWGAEVTEIGAGVRGTIGVSSFFLNNVY